MEKLCKKCGQTKAIDDFPRCKTSKSGHDAKCKHCHRESWHARKPPAIGRYEYPEGWELNMHTIRQILTFDESIQSFRWIVNTAKTRVGDVAGTKEDRQITRVYINNTRHRLDDLKSIWFTGKPLERPQAEIRNAVFDAEWMKEIRQCARGFDWSCLWKAEHSRRKSREQWNLLTTEQKRERESRRCKKTKRRSAGIWKARMRRESPSFRLREALSSRLSGLLKSATKANPKSTMAIVGCSMPELVRHLQSKFKDGMTWENYGSHWHVDHVIPVSKFNHDKPSQVKQCWHWTNLEPLGAFENMSKGAKVTRPQLSLLL